MKKNEYEENVKFIRINTGEDVIAQIVEINENNNVSFMFIKPLKILYSIGNRPGFLQISLMEWIFSKICEKQEFIISPDDVITIAEPKKELISYYWDTIAHFEGLRDEKKEKIRFSEDGIMLGEEVVYENEPDEFESVKQLLSELKNSPNKRKLH